METTGSSQLRTITQNLPQEYHLHCGLERPPLGSFRVWEPGPSQPHIVGGDRRGWRWGFEDQGAEAGQALRQLGQGGLQQLRVLVSAQTQELHPQQLKRLLDTQVQQSLAAPGIQVQAQPVAAQERQRPGPCIRILRSISCSSSCLQLWPLHRCSHRPPTVLGGQTCPSTQAGLSRQCPGKLQRQEEK